MSAGVDGDGTPSLPCAGNLFHLGDPDFRPFALVHILYHKFRPADEKNFQGNLPGRRPSRALSAGFLPSGIMIYESNLKI